MYKWQYLIIILGFKKNWTDKNGQLISAGSPPNSVQFGRRGGKQGCLRSLISPNVQDRELNRGYPNNSWTPICFESALPTTVQVGKVYIFMSTLLQDSSCLGKFHHSPSSNLFLACWSAMGLPRHQLHSNNKKNFLLCCWHVCVTLDRPVPLSVLE